MGGLVNSVADLLGVGPASKQAKAVTQAADISAQSSREALDLQRRMFERQIELQEPWRQAGITALNKLTPLATEYTPFGMQQFQQDPGYTFRMQEGMRALDRSAAARGGLLSGNTLKGALRYGQDLGSQEYTNAFNRYQTERNARLNPLQSLAGVGQTATNQLGAYGQNYANQANQLGMTNAANQGNLALAMGNIRASQYGGLGNALGSALGGGFNTNSTNPFSSMQSAFSQTSLGSSGFGTGMAYGNQDIGQYL